MNDEKFPISPYYQESLHAGKTIAKTAKRWVAVLLLEDPRSRKKFLRIYGWGKNKEGEWKRRGAISLNKSSEIRLLLSTLEESMQPVADGEVEKLAERIKAKGRFIRK